MSSQTPPESCSGMSSPVLVNEKSFKEDEPPKKPPQAYYDSDEDEDNTPRFDSTSQATHIGLDHKSADTAPESSPPCSNDQDTTPSVGQQALRRFAERLNGTSPETNGVPLIRRGVEKSAGMYPFGSNQPMSFEISAAPSSKAMETPQETSNYLNDIFARDQLPKRFPIRAEEYPEQDQGCTCGECDVPVSPNFMPTHDRVHFLSGSREKPIPSSLTIKQRESHKSSITTNTTNFNVTNRYSAGSLAIAILAATLAFTPRGCFRSVAPPNLPAGGMICLPASVLDQMQVWNVPGSSPSATGDTATDTASSATAAVEDLKL